MSRVKNDLPFRFFSTQETLGGFKIFETQNSNDLVKSNLILKEFFISGPDEFKILLCLNFNYITMWNILICIILIFPDVSKTVSVKYY